MSAFAELCKEKASADLLSLAKVAENAERYEDMCVAMKEFVKKKIAAGETLETEDRNLLSVAYKNVVGAKRSSWRTLEAGNFDDKQKEQVQKFRKQLEKELGDVCDEIINLLQKLLELHGDKQDETLVFWLKMKGDYYRYKCEFDSGNEENKTKTQKAYDEAMKAAGTCLPETHPTRLGLALNFSVCHYEILKQPKQACTLAKTAFDEAIEKLDTLNDASYKDSTLIMQLLRDNLTLWTSESDANKEAAADGTGGN